jgi:hypothetical protein
MFCSTHQPNLWNILNGSIWFLDRILNQVGKERERQRTGEKNCLSATTFSFVGRFLSVLIERTYCIITVHYNLQEENLNDRFSLFAFFDQVYTHFRLSKKEDWYKIKFKEFKMEENLQELKLYFDLK